MGKKGFYHLFSDGFRTDVLFEDKLAFIAGMNIVALCFFRCNVSILAFCLMDNHVHFILYGTKEDCLKFRDKFIHKYGIWHSNRHSGKIHETIDFDIKLMDDERYILNSIAYVLRNCIAAGYGYCASDYPWSSGGLYFRHPEINYIIMEEFSCPLSEGTVPKIADTDGIASRMENYAGRIHLAGKLCRHLPC